MRSSPTHLGRAPTAAEHRALLAVAFGQIVELRHVVAVTVRAAQLARCCDAARATA